MNVPKTAVDENDSLPFRKHNVRFPRQRLDVQTEAETVGK